MLVPPRRGTRSKSKILAPFNKSNPFQLVEIINCDQSKVYGILSEDLSKNGEYYCWIGTNLVPEKVDHNNIRAISIPHPPQIAFECFDATIGGIGKHLRWKVVISKKKHDGLCDLFVGNIIDKTKFESFIHNKIKPFGFSEFNYIENDNNVYCEVNIPEYKDLTFVAAAFHCAGYSAAPKMNNMASYGNLGIERYDRSEHTWWNQDPKKAGPLRDTHKWKYNFIPSDWKQLPFTWQSMASNINISIDDINLLPYPLKNHVCDLYLEKKFSDDEISKLRNMKTTKDCVTSRLTDAQNIQLLMVTYWSFIAPFDNHIVSLCSLIQFRYMLHGYLGREVGGYKQEAKYIGHGAYCRKFKQKSQYDYENLDVDIKNKLKKINGEILGTGFKGTRGKYGHSEFVAYKPLRKMERSIESEISIREQPYNKFQKYSDSYVGAD